MYFAVLRPYAFMVGSCRYTKWCPVIGYYLLVMAIYTCCVVAPSADFQQGEIYRIMYVHVPAAWLSIMVYVGITITSVLFLLTKQPLFASLSKTGAQIGTLFTVFTVLTGCLWGKPLWGTFWVWDARLTSVLILLFIYLGALRFMAISAEIASILICLGLLNIPVIKFSVYWWNTLHQPSSITQFGASIHMSMLVPILLMFAFFWLVSFVLVVLEARQFLLSAYSVSLSKQIK